MNNPKVALLDIDIFAQEGFTNGIFLTFREFFKRFQQQDIPCSFISISHNADLSKQKRKEYHKQRRQVRGIAVEDHTLPCSANEDITTYSNTISDSLAKYSPSLIFMYTPAVFFEEIHIISLERALDTGARVVVLLADALYPTKDKHPSKNVSKYYALLKKAEVICTSKHIIRTFEKEVGIRPRYFPNIFSPEEITCQEKNQEYITLVNHHPIKGIEIFNKLAVQMPDKKFLVVQTWPDVPEYKRPSKNVTFSHFIEDVRDLYARTKIILIPSLYEEGPSRLMIEAMLNGIPVIANRIGSLPEVGQDFATFIKPPDIYQSDMIGTVIYPRVQKGQIERVVNDYVKAIGTIDESQEEWQKHSKLAYSRAQLYCKQVDNDFSLISKEWLGTKD